MGTVTVGLRGGSQDSTPATVHYTVLTSGFPDASTTGVPAGTALTPSGSIAITTPGQVVENRHIRGTVTIAAPNVTIRNCLVDVVTSAYPIRIDSGATGALVVDTEVRGGAGTGINVLVSGGADGATIRRCDLNGGEDSIRIGANSVTLDRCYLHDLHRQPGGHHDTVQVRAGDNITIRGCTLLPYVAATDDPMNAAIQIGSLSGTNPISNLLVEDCYMDGGNYTVNGGRAEDIDSARYRRNRFGRHHRFGVRGNMHSTVWEASNVYHDNGQPA